MQHMKNRLIMFLTMVLSVVTGTLFVANPSYAVSGCPSGWICFYDTSVSANPMEYRDGADWGPGECYYMPSVANNKTSYIWNRSNKAWKVHNVSCAGDLGGTIYANSSGSMGSTYNNNISAYNG
jgi:hypothetical protein